MTFADEQRRQEQALQDSLNYAESIIATLREPFLVLDDELKVKRANRRFYETFEVSPEETEGQFVYDLGNQQWNIPALRKLLAEVLSNNHPIHDFEIDHEFPLIGRRIMKLNARRLESVNHRPDLILLAFEDITERKRASDLLRRSERRYRRLFESAKDGILILAASTGKITDANPYIQQLLGYAADELLSKELWQIGLFQDIDASKAAFEQLQQQGYIRYHNLPLETKDGRRLEVEFVSNLYHEDHEDVIQCNVRDISERSQLERAAAKAEALAVLNRRKDEFMAMLSHELRNPLAPIFAAAHLLSLQPEETAIQLKARKVIQRQIGQLRRLVDDLLDVSRVTTGRISLKPEEVDLRSIVQRAVDSVRSLLDQRSHKLSVSLPPDPISVNADVTRLEQVVVNLLNNAAKYTDEGGHIRLSAEKDGDLAVLRVRDTGVGIAPEVLENIFDPFSQAERTMDRAQGGLGIGLTVVQKIVELHHGHVEAASAGIGQGSEFTVWLPIFETESRESNVSTSDESVPETFKILIVDDNVDATDMLAGILRLVGHDVQVAYSGQSALEVAMEFQPTIVLLDIGLPEMNGYEVARRLRQRPQSKDTLLIAMTGYGQDSDLQRSTQAGFDYHLVKPVDPEKLEGLFTRLMMQAHPRPGIDKGHED
jgi:PAS domain S-box-containing protein